MKLENVMKRANPFFAHSPHFPRFITWISGLLLAGFLIPSLIAGQAGPGRNLQIDDLFGLSEVGDPRLSPDGQWVAYTVSTMDPKANQEETAIWMVPSSGGEAIRMTAAGYSARDPRWSPDGKYLSFEADRDEGNDQVWAFDRRGGDARQLTAVKQGIQTYVWSPDGKRILLTIQDPEPDELGEPEKGKDKPPRPWVIDRLQFKRDEIGYLDRRRTHLYVFDLDSKSLTQITSGDFDDSGAVWSPDGKLVAFVSNRTEDPDRNSNTDIWIVSADNSDQGKTLLQLTTNPGQDTEPAWSPDGKTIGYVTNLQPDLIWYATNRLATVPSKGGPARILAPALDRNVSNPRFSSDSASIRFLIEDSGESQLARVSLPTGEVEHISSGSRVVQGFDSAGDDRFVLLVSEPQLPSEVFSLSGGRLAQLTFTNQGLLRQLKLSRVENVHFPSRDGTEIEGFIYLPPDYNEHLTYPTLLRIHGGPVMQFDFSFDFEAQLFAANEYVVVLVNPRGSSGYGQDFSMGIYRNWGRKDFEDVMAGVDFAIRQGYADPNRLGVGGWSYGGILTNYVITQTDRFKAAISGASEVLYVANYGHDHYQYEWEKELGLPWENRELWERLSPFNSVQKIVTPTLILCGSEDWNVPLQNSEQLYEALKRLGRTTQLVVYPGEHHGLQVPTFLKDRLERYLDWYGRFVKGGLGAASGVRGQPAN